MISLETETTVPSIKLRNVTHVTFYSGASALCDLGVEQIQVNVIRQPKTAKKK